jgi:glycosyltransferase involved in cell wall biosynthesis
MAEQFPNVSLTLFTNRENDSILRKDLASFKQVEYRLLYFKASNRYVRIIREQTELPLRVNRDHIDVLWSPGYTAPFFCRCPQVTSILDMQYKRHPEDLSTIARVITALLILAAAKRSRRIITISEFSKNEIIRYTSTSPDNIHPILLAAASEFANSFKKEAGRKDHSSPMPFGRPYILSVANSYPHKNLHTLVEAFKQLIHRIEHNLVLIGLPRLGEEMLQKAIDQIPDKNRIIRIGRATTEKLIDWYRFSDLFVFPSIYEGFGLPVLEAMAAGTPVVTTRMGSIPEVGGNHVIYADPPNADVFANKILEVLKWDEKQRTFWVRSAKHRADAFSWHTTAKKTMKVLKEARANGFSRN